MSVILEKITSDLLAWGQANFILIKPTTHTQIFELPKFGNCYLMLPVKGKLLDVEMCFEFSGDDFEFEDIQVRVEQKEVDYLIFQFGTQFYYCKPVLIKDSYGELRYSIDFLDLKYVGTCTEPDAAVNHLGIHTEYDLLSGNGLKNYLRKAKHFGATHVGMCDRNTLAGTLAWQVEAQKVGLKSVLGETVVVATNYNPETPSTVPITYELKLYIATWEGWQNLLQINKLINVDYPKFIPEVELQKHQKGLVCVAGYQSYLNFKNKAEVVKWLHKFKNFEGRFFQVDCSEFFAPADDLQRLEQINDYLKGNYLKLLPPILIQDVYYCDRDMFIVRDYLNKVAKRAWDYSKDQYFKSMNEVLEQMAALFQNMESFTELYSLMLENLQQVCDVCSEFKIEIGKHKLPKYEFVPEDISKEDFFDDLLAKGFSKKIIENNLDTKKYLERLQMEREVILEAGFIDYFLILLDIIGWAKSNDIMVGPGRGSVGGSLLAYVLDIIDIDPIFHNLSFERFMNKARLSGERAKSADSLPDIDVDFESKYRDVIKEYISQHFGELYTCSIGTFTNFQLKGGIKDFGATKGLQFSYLNFVNASIATQPLDYTFKDFVNFAIKDTKGELYKFFQTNPEIVHVIKYTLAQPKAASIHASAVLILPKEQDGVPMDLFNWLPVRLMDGKYVSEWEGSWTDKYGALKEDILGLTQLDQFKAILKLIEQNYHKKIELNSIPLEDSKTYAIFKKGYNENIFQFNTRGMQNYSRQVKPDHFEDLVAMSALWRPGPMGSNAHLDYALFKHGKKEPHFDYGLKSVTEYTQGLFIYQEQMMAALVVLGGFTPVESDIARTQIKKFDAIGMAESEQRFIAGAIKNGCKKEEAQKIWSKLLSFGDYGFNRAHSSAYSHISYWAQWLKAHYPLEFWVVSFQYADEEQIPAMISEMNKLQQGITIKPPDINNSEIDFQCAKENKSIYWSLAKIKGLGAKTVEYIIAARGKKKFASYDDFVARVPKAKVNRGHIEKMILSGCFDEIEELDQPHKRMGLLHKHLTRLKLEVDLQFTKPEAKKNYVWTLLQKQLTGYGDISFKELIQQSVKAKKYSKLLALPDVFFKKSEYELVMVCGIVSDIFERRTKKGDTFIILTLINNNEPIKVLVWDSIIEANVEFLEKCEGKVIALTGKVRFDTYQQVNSVHCTEETEFFYL